MKYSTILPFAAIASALVVPPENVLAQVSIQDNHREAVTEDDLLSFFEDYFKSVADSSRRTWDQVSEASNNVLDQAFDYASDAVDTVNNKVQETAFDVDSWLESASDDVYESLDGHHGPHEPPHHGPPNQTVYQLISESKYTTVLAKLINKYDDLVEALNGTSANYTVFAPTDKAFKKIPEGAPEPSREQLFDILSYHVIPEFYPAKRVLVSHTAPTLLKSDSLGNEPKPQRVSFNVGLRGLTVNFFSRVVAINIFGTNGVIHGVDSLIIPPPQSIEAIALFPGEFSTFELGLRKTGLWDMLNGTDHPGGTMFAPSNFAFRKLGPKINAFLFSSYGQKYLEALLKYHVVRDNTLYSDAYYSADGVEQEGVPKGYFHIDLPTLLENRTVSVDIARYGGFISIKVNAFSRVVVQDGIVKDGVIHVVGDVIVPPKKIGGPGGDEEAEYWDGETEMSVEEFSERLAPFVGKEDL